MITCPYNSGKMSYSRKMPYSNIRKFVHCYALSPVVFIIMITCLCNSKDFFLKKREENTICFRLKIVTATALILAVYCIGAYHKVSKSVPKMSCVKPEKTCLRGFRRGPTQKGLYRATTEDG